ncbi:MAG TPA: phosphotransferase [Acidimicrobiales bacterium]|nr:phosphotransferase [Acidimicrobiales bacterium]
MLVAVRLVDSVIDEIDEAFGVQLGREPARLPGGEESAAFRCGDLVVRVGPTWRADDELEWANEVALAAADVVAEVVAPLLRPDGSTVVRIDDRPVTLWPYVEGTKADDRDDDVRLQAADLLARLHRVLGRVTWRPRPAFAVPLAPTPDLDDHDLDTWLAIFDRDHPSTMALHGDFCAGNVLVDDGRITALIDWDEALLGPPERELAWAAWEWGDCLHGGDLAPALTFVDAYRAAGGPARRIGEHDLRQLVRQRLRWESGYRRAHTPFDLEYESLQLRAFHRLRVPSRS